MTHEEKILLAHTGDTSKEATGLRLLAARKVAGLSQKALGEAAGVTKAAISNAEKAISFPGRETLIYLHAEHRIDLNFTIYGNFNQLPVDVQNALFEALSSANSERALAKSSGLRPNPQ